MKRRPRKLLKLGVFVLAGAIVNVAVAWGCASARESMTIERNQQGHFAIWDRPWLVVQQRRFGMIDVWWSESDNPRSIPTDQIVKDRIEEWKQVRLSQPRMKSGRPREQLSHASRWGTFAGEPLPPHIVDGGDIAFGFPSVCLWMQTTCDIINLTTTNVQLHGAWHIRGRVEARGNEFIALPNRIIFPGFAINTIFYAAVLWLLFAAPGTIRRSVRRRRGQCPACGYPVGQSPTCTECGNTVRPQCVETAAACPNLEVER